jgi:hypothetical protein
MRRRDEEGAVYKIEPMSFDRSDDRIISVHLPPVAEETAFSSSYSSARLNWYDLRAGNMALRRLVGWDHNRRRVARGTLPTQEHCHG